MSRRTGFLSVVACCAYPVLSHLGVVTGEGLWAAVGLALLAWGVLAARKPPAFSALVGGLTLALALGLNLVFPAAVLFAPPVAIYLALCAMFASTLRRGDEPLVSRFARLEHGGELPPDLVRYMRTLTALWVLFFAAMAAISLGLALRGRIETWSLFTNFVSYALVAGCFLGEYLYRRWRYRNYPHVGFVDFLRGLASYRVWNRSADGRLADGP